MSVLPMKKGQRAALEGDGVYLASQVAELTSHVNSLMMSYSFILWLVFRLHLFEKKLFF
jgi:hypothetical protein